MTGGVQAAKAARRHGYVAFRPPSLWRRMGQTRKARGIRDSAARKIARRCHVSAGFARAELMGFVGLLLKDKKIAAPLAAELELEAEEIALLLGSTTTTKKVQVLFEEAQKIREAEKIEEIELAWHGTAQRSLGRAPQVGASEMRETSVKSEPTQVAEPILSADPEVGPSPAEPSAAKSEAKKRGRPRKAESEAKVEKAEVKPEAKTEMGKKQKSLFDF
jgi:replication factor C large subunit